MYEQQLDIPTPEGGPDIQTFLAYPETGGPFPAVLFYMDAPGKREELKEMARRLAAAGYYVVLPNLYYRRVKEYELPDRSDASMAVMFEHMDSLDNAMIVRDTATLLQFIDSQPDADGRHVGAVGYCMSGPFVLAAAAAFPERIHSVAAIHGARMVTDKPDSPHLMAPQIHCETYVGCAEIDKWAPPADIATLEAAFKAAGTPHRIEWYPGAEHGFVFPKRAVYQEAGAERHWERLFDLFKRTLQVR